MVQRSKALEIYPTKDGSNTLYVPSLDETYHSRNGALEESKYVFIKQGLAYWLNQTAAQKVHVFEVGFGTGLNAALTFNCAKAMGIELHYTAIELYPLQKEVIDALHFDNLLDPSEVKFIEQLHAAPWNEAVTLEPKLTLHKLEADIIHWLNPSAFVDVIYMDAFGPDKQPELWTAAIFQKLHDILNPCGVLVTYSSKGEVKRTMQSEGFTIERLPGPPMKRHMLRGSVE